MSEKKIITPAEEHLDKGNDKIVPVVPEFRQGVCAQEYAQSLKKKIDESINMVLQHAKATDSHAC
jgi:hypothetical protein